jgi:hypothetical protein
MADNFSHFIGAVSISCDASHKITILEYISISIIPRNLNVSLRSEYPCRRLVCCPPTRRSPYKGKSPWLYNTYSSSDLLAIRQIPRSGYVSCVDSISDDNIQPIFSRSCTETPEICQQLLTLGGEIHTLYTRNRCTIVHSSPSTEHVLPLPNLPVYSSHSRSK